MRESVVGVPHALDESSEPIVFQIRSAVVGRSGTRPAVRRFPSVSSRAGGVGSPCARRTRCPAAPSNPVLLLKSWFPTTRSLRSEASWIRARRGSPRLPASAMSPPFSTVLSAPARRARGCLPLPGGAADRGRRLPLDRDLVSGAFHKSAPVEVVVSDHGQLALRGLRGSGLGRIRRGALQRLRALGPCRLRPSSPRNASISLALMFSIWFFARWRSRPHAPRPCGGARHGAWGGVIIGASPPVRGDGCGSHLFGSSADFTQPCPGGSPGSPVSWCSGGCAVIASCRGGDGRSLRSAAPRPALCPTTPARWSRTALSRNARGRRSPSGRR